MSSGSGVDVAVVMVKILFIIVSRKKIVVKKIVFVPFEVSMVMENAINMM